MWNRPPLEIAHITMSTYNMATLRVTLSMDVVENKLIEEYLVLYFRDALLHGNDMRSVKCMIEEMNPNYKVFVDTHPPTNEQQDGTE
jgi:hypothetical protein